MITTLIVEDNLPFRKAFKDALLFYFPYMGIQEASDSGEALRIVHDQCPMLVFMDIRLSGENGLELTQKIKEIAPLTKVVILTSYDEPEYLEAAAAVGATCFVVKRDLDMEGIQSLVYQAKVIGQ